MPGPIDDALKHLTELSPQDWVVRAGWPAAAAALIDADIGTISGAADKVIRVSSTPDWLLAIDFQSGHDSVAKLPDLLLYNSALFKRHGLPVRTLLVLLHRGADSRKLTGLYERGFPGEPFDAALRYRVLRIWEIPAATWLSGGLGLVPLAPLGSVQKADLPAVVAQMKQRFDRETPSQAKELWSAAYILMGLRYERAMIQLLLRGVVNMKESVTYQAILEEGEAIGKAEEARKMLLLQGRDRFGEPSAKIVALLDAVTDLGRLEALVIRLLHVKTWEELLGGNGTTRHPRRRRKT
jgi:hypothetical protein